MMMHGLTKSKFKNINTAGAVCGGLISVTSIRPYHII
jgi:hypothetical protein